MSQEQLTPAQNDNELFDGEESNEQNQKNLQKLDYHIENQQQAMNIEEYDNKEKQNTEPSNQYSTIISDNIQTYYTNQNPSEFNNPFENDQENEEFDGQNNQLITYEEIEGSDQYSSCSTQKLQDESNSNSDQESSYGSQTILQSQQYFQKEESQSNDESQNMSEDAKLEDEENKFKDVFNSIVGKYRNFVSKDKLYYEQKIMCPQIDYQFKEEVQNYFNQIDDDFYLCNGSINDHSSSFYNIYWLYRSNSIVDNQKSLAYFLKQLKMHDIYNQENDEGMFIYELYYSFLNECNEDSESKQKNFDLSE
ncbi:hypothetical protein TTHERM_00624370 (macronuclear) [Tetrahymena thermophila SB210]|uniref:Uncharacterized protein n=1 Tax=Tetrahymena thermophila (strain SB210) TaxID=312017 RepID=Q240U6_TETTS|nr:hypothetical protein TTHERM_00624370 [Tetrahymena thermophila SB210]EAS02318.2 hypothetical protein TTHERM_00624370 [Tetrahymena thermophila SB210]|eukprot:XP_001022563.2 hypothetical protein TTHERM_00624370 [Tetrahymena thermophila SB210]